MRWKITTSHELVYHQKPAYRQLFRLPLSHEKDGIHNRTTTDSHSLQGIAVDYSHIANGMEIYNPTNKQLYTTTVFKLDEDNATRNHFNLHYHGSMFFGLYSSNSPRNYAEPFPPGTAIQFQKDSSKDPLQGFIVAVPDVKFTDDTATYLVRLDDGSTESVPAALLQHWSAPSIDSSDAATASPYPSWVSHNSHCTMEHNGNILKGKFFHLPDDTWEFHSTNRNGILKQRYPLPNFSRPLLPLLTWEFSDRDGPLHLWFPLLITSLPKISPGHALAISPKPWITRALMH